MENKTGNQDGILMGMCNPLLDISAVVSEELLAKYGAKLNTACLADAKHLPLYKELMDNYKVEYIAGGAGQNTIRVAQWMLQKPKATIFFGAVGSGDSESKILRTAVSEDGVTVYYHEDTKQPTGTCAVLIHNHDRALIANLGAANTYKLEHLLQPEIQPVWKAAQYYYVTGFFLTVSPESIMHVARHADLNKKIFAMNLSAPFISEFFSDPLLDAMPYVDYIFGNESESKALATKMGWKCANCEEIALQMESLPKKNKSRPRVVVITQGPDPTILVHEGRITTHPCPSIAKEDMVDLNGAGDAFVGGFLSQLIAEQPLEVCIRAGQYAAREIIKVSGCVVKGTPSFSAK